MSVRLLAYERGVSARLRLRGAVQGLIREAPIVIGSPYSGVNRGNACRPGHPDVRPSASGMNCRVHTGAQRSMPSPRAGTVSDVPWGA
jgi:hypothetical protein